ncbi:MAG: cytochrome-c peroxidase [bacterium]|nr:cytochrome-c peroxidase [bacterium]
MIPLCLSLLFIAGCTDIFTKKGTIDKRLRRLIDAHGLTGNPAQSRNLPSINSPKAQLGMQLFFTKALGGSMDSACVTCHHPALGGGDNLSLSIGVDAVSPDLLGPGRLHSPTGTNHDGGPTVPRNAPTTFNIGLWDVALFLDGRVESLDATANANGQGDRIRTPDTPFGTTDPNAGDNLTVAQARFPVTSPEEMRGFTFEAGNSNDAVRSHLASRLRNEIPAELTGGSWLQAFRTGFEQPTGTAAELITFGNIVDAIGTYERSQVFVNTPWKEYVEGNGNALTDAQKRGAVLFFKSVEKGGANCAGCHSGDFFTDEKYHNIAMPQIGRGKGDDNGSTTSDDFGRFRETGDPEDLYAFRTPTLLNVDATGPWGHDGAYTTLEGVVRHHLDPEKAILNYDLGQLENGIQTDDWGTNTLQALQNLKERRNQGLFTIENIRLDREEIRDLIEFLSALTDPCVKDRNCIAPWIPDASLPDPDNLRLNAVDEDGNPL